MNIRYIGHSSFRIKGKTSTGEYIKVVTDPFNPKQVGLPYPKQETDVVTSSHEGHGDHDWYEGIKGENQKDYFLINVPGEYEIKGLRIYGVKSFHDDKKGAERGFNTIYIFDFEEARIAHLGDIGHTLSSDQIEALESVDILMIPVGGFYTIGPSQAISVIETIEPKIVIPMHYKTEKHTDAFAKLATLEDFAKETSGKIEKDDELKIKSRSDLPQELKIVAL